MNGYNLIRNWYSFKFENPKTTKAIHSDMYCYIVDLWNRLGQKKEFGLPTSVTMECLNIGSYNTYKKTLNDLIEFGFVKIVKESKNQHQSKIIALSKNDKALDKALDKATIKATDKATDSIDKQYNNITKEQINTEFSEVEIMYFSFEDFWNLYPNKTNKAKAKESFNKIPKKDLDTLENHLNYFINNKPFKEYSYPHATTYLNQKRYLDEININKNNNGTTKITDTTEFKQIVETIKSEGVRR